MLNGERFRAELQRSADDIRTGRVPIDLKCAERALIWKEIGGEAIDQNDTQAMCFLLAAIGNLLDQHMIIVQGAISINLQKRIRLILVPLWISALALLLIALK